MSSPCSMHPLCRNGRRSSGWTRTSSTNWFVCARRYHRGNFTRISWRLRPRRFLTWLIELLQGGTPGETRSVGHASETFTPHRVLNCQAAVPFDRATARSCATTIAEVLESEQARPSLCCSCRFRNECNGPVRTHNLDHDLRGGQRDRGVAGRGRSAHRADDLRSLRSGFSLLRTPGSRAARLGTNGRHHTLPDRSSLSSRWHRHESMSSALHGILPGKGRHSTTRRATAYRQESAMTSATAFLLVIAVMSGKPGPPFRTMP